jgi:hypothetical protein
MKVNAFVINAPEVDELVYQTQLVVDLLNEDS